MKLLCSSSSISKLLWFSGRLRKNQSFIEGKKALFIVYANPLALGLLTPPGSFGADIVVETHNHLVYQHNLVDHTVVISQLQKLMRKVHD